MIISGLPLITLGYAFQYQQAGTRGENMIYFSFFATFFSQDDRLRIEPPSGGGRESLCR